MNEKRWARWPVSRPEQLGSMCAGTSAASRGGARALESNQDLNLSSSSEELTFTSLARLSVSGVTYI